MRGRRSACWRRCTLSSGARYAEAALGASDLARTATDIQTARLSVAEADHAALRARAALARALALPLRAVERLETRSTSTEGCPTLDSTRCRLPRHARRRQASGGDARTGRVRRGRIAPAARSGAAVSRPRAGTRLHLGSGRPPLDAGARAARRFWAAGTAAPSGRPKPPVRSPHSRSRKCRTRFRPMSKIAIQRCRGAALELGAADSVIAAASRQVERERAAYQRGETSRLEPARAELQLLARRARATAGPARASTSPRSSWSAPPVLPVCRAAHGRIRGRNPKRRQPAREISISARAGSSSSPSSAPSWRSDPEAAATTAER